MSLPPDGNSDDLSHSGEPSPVNYPQLVADCIRGLLLFMAGVMGVVMDGPSWWSAAGMAAGAGLVVWLLARAFRRQRSEDGTAA